MERSPSDSEVNRLQAEYNEKSPPYSGGLYFTFQIRSRG